jgi:ADP-ribosylation factor-like protein 2
VKKFNGDPINEISPTLGFNIFTLEFMGFKLNIWDVGGQKTIRSYWRNYFEQTDALVRSRLISYWRNELLRADGCVGEK